MTLSRTRWLTAAVVAAGGAAACSRAPRESLRASPQPATAPGVLPAVARARGDSTRNPYTEADIRFMSGMIGHHAQAIVMAGWAPGHGAGASVRLLARRIINAQQDEIVTMQQWLRDLLQPVPEAHATGMTMHGAEPGMLMPGMLTEVHMHRLDEARGAEFDRLFLVFMIQHHRGAVSMVRDLLGTYGAAQDQTVFKLASDVNVDQTTEIARIERMLAALTLEGRSP